MSDNVTGTTGRFYVLKDEDTSWSKVPYQVILGNTFVTLQEAMEYTLNTWGGFTKTGNPRANGIYDMPGAYSPPSWGGANSLEAAGVDGITSGLAPELKSSSMTADGLPIRPFFQDTRVGANDAINCFYQFNRDDDIMSEALISDKDYNYGMGRVYNNTTQRNQTIAFFTFGIPVYRQLIPFLRTAVNSSLARVNGVGYDKDNMFSLGEIFGKLVGWIAFPILIIPFRILRFTSHWLKNSYVNKFVSLRSEMTAYYSYVDSILAQWLVATGLYGNGGIDGKAAQDRIDKTAEKEDQWMVSGMLNYLIPGFISSQSSLPPALAVTGPSIMDIMGLRARILGLQYAPNAPGTGDRQFAKSKEDVHPLNQAIPTTPETIIKSDIGMIHTARARAGYEGGDPVDDDNANFAGFIGERIAEPDTSTTSSIVDYAKSVFKKFTSSAQFSAVGGTTYVGFRVEKGTGVSESFSNSTTPSTIGSFLNNSIKTAHKALEMAKIAEAEAAIKDDSFTGKVMKFLQGGVEGLSSAAGLDYAVEAISTNSFIDIPDEYESSQYSKSFNISFQLRSPYGDMVSIYESIIIPLALILAAAMPRGAGQNSYQAPFHLKSYCPGRFSVPIGMIESLSINRGSSDFGWTYQNIPTCIDISVGIKDLSSATFMTLRGQGLFNTITADDNNFTEYINTLAGVGLYERVTGILQYRRRFQMLSHQVRNKYFNPHYWATSIGNGAFGQIVGLVQPISAVPSA